MRKIAILLLSVLLVAASAFAANPKDQAFVDAYKAAFEKNDTKTLESFLYTKGADPGAEEFYKMMMAPEPGAKIKNITLQDLTPDDVKEATAIQPMPDGGNAKLPVTPTKKLVLDIEMTGPSGSSTSHSESFVAEVEGKYMIPVPGPVK